MSRHSRTLKYISCQSRFTSMGSRSTAAAIPATIIRRSFRIFSRFLRLTIRNAAPSRQITPSMRNCAFSKPITAVVNMLSRARKSIAVKNAARAIFVPRLSGKG